MGIHFKTQKILALPAQKPAKRDDYREKQNRHDDGTGDSVQGETQLEPSAVQRHQPMGAKECDGQDGGGQSDQHPFRRTGLVKQWPKARDREKNAKREAKLPIRPEAYLTEARDRFMCLHQATIVNPNLLKRGQTYFTD
ncbi:MAG: hypothetical protein ACREDM_02160 [Methylocella sp.]